MFAKVIKTGKLVDVRQAEAGADYFIDLEQNPYKVTELDFVSVKGLPDDAITGDNVPFVNMAKILENQTADAWHQARADKYREIAGQMVVQMIANNPSVTPKGLGELVAGVMAAVKVMLTSEKLIGL